MDKLELQKLRDLPIEGVAERLGLRVLRHKSLCPFHDDHHASLSFNTHKNNCRCFVCMNESVGTIDLVMRHLQMNFKEACQWLADSHNMIREEWKPTSPLMEKKEDRFDASRYEGFFVRPFLSDEARKFLFDERKLDTRVVRWCRISSWRDRNGVNWLQIPYYDMEGKLIRIQNRNLHKGASPRFMFPYGSQCGIYNLPVVKMLKQGDELYITEGCSDCWAMLSAGHKAIAIPSATLLTPKDKEMLASLSSSLSLTFHMYPDKDAPGELLFLHLKEILPNIVHHQLPTNCKDFSDYYIQQKSNKQHEM